ncbi:MAG: class I SAM-dependent methyltransferase [Halobacteriales archaeon]
MRRFGADYLRYTRRGMWSDGDRGALAGLDLPNRERVLDAGCGTGALTRVLAEETPGVVLGVDADRRLLRAAGNEPAGDRAAGEGAPPDWARVAGDATRLPVRAGGVDLVVCQALLSNLPAPAAAVREFARASSGLVAAIEPDNAAVAVSSTVEREADLEARARRAYLEGLRTDAALGGRVPDLFRAAGLGGVGTRQYRHEKRVEPPYDERELADARRKASGEGLAAHEAELRRAPGEDYDDLRAAWREMGRAVVAAMRAGTYRRVEAVPFDVTVGRVEE